MDIGIIPGEIGILTEYRGVTGTPPGVNGPTWALVEREGIKGSVGRAPTRPKLNWFRARGAGPLLLVLICLLPKGAHQPLVGWCASLLWPIRPITSPRGFR